jgi:hypothetical protein
MKEVIVWVIGLWWIPVIYFFYKKIKSAPSYDDLTRRRARIYHEEKMKLWDERKAAAIAERAEKQKARKTAASSPNKE